MKYRIAVRDEDFDTFTAESTSWWAQITPTVSRREMAQMPGSFFALTPTCERVDVVTERVSDLSASKLTRRVTVFDRDGLTVQVPTSWPICYRRLSAFDIFEHESRYFVFVRVSFLRSTRAKNETRTKCTMHGL
jgi:hypothetical protein